MNTAKIKPREGYFVEVMKEDGSLHIIHSCEAAGDSQELALKCIIGCYMESPQCHSVFRYG